VFVRDTANADGWGLIDAVAVGSVLTSAGPGTVPTWNTNPTLTNGIAIGSLPATVGAIRMTNNQAIRWRDAGNTADLIGIKVNASDVVELGTPVAIGPTNVAASGALRFGANQFIYSRNTANTADVSLLGLSTADNKVYVGGFANDAGLVLRSSSQVSFQTSGTDRWTITSSGHFVPATDNAFDIGDATHQVRNLYIAGSLVGSFSFSSLTVGTLNLSGSIVLTGATGTQAIGDATHALASVYTRQVVTDSGQNLRLVATGTANVVFSTNAGDRWGVGNTGTFYPVSDNAYQIGAAANRPLAIYVADAGLKWGDTASFVALRRSGTEVQAVLGDASDYATFRAKTIPATSSFQTTTAGTYIAIGTPTATTGAVRLPNATGGVFTSAGIYSRNAANTADVMLLGLGSDGRTYTGNTLAPQADNSYDLGVTGAAWRSTVLTTSVSIGTNPSTTGVLRLPYAGAIRSRNSDNTADVDVIQVGGLQTVVGNTSMITSIVGGTLSVQLNPSGWFHPGTDNAIDLGHPSFGYRNAYIRGAISVGTANYATGGAIRLTNNVRIMWRNSTNTADLGFILTNGNGFMCDGIYLAPSSDNGATLGYDTASYRWQYAYLGAALTVGNNPATVGHVRLPVNGSVIARNAANAGDVTGLYVGSDTIVYVGDSAAGYSLRLRGTSAVFDGPVSGLPSLAIGTNPAQSGAVRLANAAAIAFRNAANTVDVFAMSTDGSNFTIFRSLNGFGWYDGSSTPAWNMQANAAGVNSPFYPAFDNQNDFGGTANRIKSGYFGTMVSIGTNPAASGAIRLANNTTITARNAANSGDLTLIQSFVDDGVIIGGSGVPSVTPGTDDAIAFGLSTSRRWKSVGVSQYVEVGANPSSTGVVRLPNGQSVNARNAANTGDIGLLRTNAADQVLIGATTNWTAIRTLLSATPTPAAGFWWMEETGSSPSRQLRLAAVGSDGVTYYQNIGTPH